MERWCLLARRHAPAISVKSGNGTSGRAGVQTSSMSQLLRWKWKSGKTTATGTRNSAFLLYKRGRDGRVSRRLGCRRLLGRSFRRQRFLRGLLAVRDNASALSSDNTQERRFYRLLCIEAEAGAFIAE